MHIGDADPRAEGRANRLLGDDGLRASDLRLCDITLGARPIAVVIASIGSGWCAAAAAVARADAVFHTANAAPMVRTTASRIADPRPVSPRMRLRIRDDLLTELRWDGGELTEIVG